MTKKILLTTPTFPPVNSGLGNSVQKMAKFIGNQDWEVVVATSGHIRSQYRDSYSGSLVEQFNIKGADSIAQPLQGDIDGFVKYLKESKFDVILMNAWQIWSTDLVLSHCTKIGGKKILYSHCISTNSVIGKFTLHSVIRYLAWRPYWWSMPRKMKLLDGIIFLADSGCDARFDDAKLATRLGINQIVIPNSISESALTNLDTGPKNFLERNGLLSVGAYDWQKGHDFVLRAYASSSLKNRAPLDICGQKFSGFSRELESLASNLGLDPNYVHFHEGMSELDLVGKYSKARLFIYGSHTECQPLVILDAMATGTPFISRASGSIPLMRGGIVVYSDAEAASAMNDLYDNQQGWESLSQEGRADARSKHSPAKVEKLLMTALANF
jgi:glycosyltransferase involved in cell wall biosynthesis